MELNFINRKQELSFLDKKYHSKKPELIITYGRRRIGKTELLSKFSENKDSMYFMGRLESKEATMKRFNNLLIQKFNDEKILNNPLTNWDTIFDYIAEKTYKRMLLVIDEFPFIVDKFPEIISILQDKWDSKLKSTQIMIVLCGSSISMMEKYTIDYSSPLYGRRTGQWKVNELDVTELPKFFPEYSTEKLVELYGCLDAIPGYLTKFDPKKTVFENIQERILSKGEFLYEEVEILLREEFRDISNYLSILAAVASGTTMFNEIYSRTGLDKSMLSKYLHILEKVRIIEKIIPITDTFKSKLKAKGALYILKDNFFDFWLRFVYLNQQELERGNSAKVIEDVKKAYPQFLGYKFEQFCRELLSYMKIIDFNAAGKWWHKDQEIDIVALNERNNEILFAECKWKDNVDANIILDELREKAKLVKWGREKRKEQFCIFAKSFKKKMNVPGVHLLDLKDIKKALAR